ncbi:hypothetical protein B0H13DRAFT_1928237 [Mycena leptocephala]|nr:hypothetical protein B0H13DRAFT_1928237 [Mycena leptocephala]
MPPKRSALWDFYTRGPKQNSSHYTAFCKLCIKHHLGPAHPSNLTPNIVDSLEWDDPTYRAKLPAVTVNELAAAIAEQATELIGWILSHGRVRDIFDKAQFAKTCAVLVYLMANITRWTTHYLAFQCLLELKVPLRHAAYLQRDDIIAAQVGAEKNAKAKAKMTATANKHCDLIESNDFWSGLETVVDDIEPICYATNINQADRTRADQVLLTFAGVFRHFKDHKLRGVSQAMCTRIEKRWAALDQPLFVFCLILNPYECVDRFGDKADLNLYRRVHSRPTPDPISDAERENDEKQAFLHYMQGTGDFAPWQGHRATFQKNNGDNPILVWQQFKRCSAAAKLADFAILLLGLVVNQASNERSFSDIKIKKTRLRNRLGIPKLEKMSKFGSSMRTEHLEAGLTEARKPRDVHDATKASTLISVPRYADVLEASDEETEEGQVQRKDLFPRSLALLFGGVVARAVEKPRRAQFTREVLLMELLATEETDEEPDDGALPGSEDEYSDS